MKKTAIFLSLATLFVSFGISSVSAAGSGTVPLSPLDISANTGDTFDVTVTVNPKGELLDTARVELGFDASLLEVMSISLGSQFTHLSPFNEIDNENGSVSYGAFVTGTPVSLIGTFATVSFHALSAGVAIISVKDTTKLIADGVEKLDAEGLGALTVSIDGASIAPEASNPTLYHEASLEQQALVYFGAFYGRMPSNGNDWSALHCIAYGGCQGSPRNLQAEQVALITFGAKYAKMPATNMEWNVIHTLAYTDFLSIE